MITPSEANALRGVRETSHYKKAELEIDEILCGPPNEGETWIYDLPNLRDHGALKRTIVGDYAKAGWRATVAGNRITLYYEAPPTICERCSHAPHVGVCLYTGYNPSTHEGHPCTCTLRTP